MVTQDTFTLRKYVAWLVSPGLKSLPVRSPPPALDEVLCTYGKFQDVTSKDWLHR